MTRHLLLGTAGHIDHGKTALVKALTGTDTNRLPEEKARGITIDIGFAELDLGDLHLGIIDVPGHERFIPNMLAGATGIDLGLLVVAANDSIMPQTREHFAILKMLGITQGVIALTKIDLVDDTIRGVAELEIREMVAGSFLQDAPIIATSCLDGQGIEALKIALRSAGEAVSLPQQDAPFHLAIDRVFVRQGHGTIVTGSVLSGTLRVGDEVDWHRTDGSRETVRVRSLNNHGRDVDILFPRQRGGINLAGVASGDVHRGQGLAAKGFLQSSRLISVRLHVNPEAVRALKHRVPVRLHVGSNDVLAKVLLLDADAVEPGQSAVAQLLLREPITAVWGQRFIVRDSSAEQTLGGGRILDPTAQKLRRRRDVSNCWLEKLEADDAATRITAVAWLAGFTGVTAADLTRLAGLAPGDCERIAGTVLSKFKRSTSPERIAELQNLILRVLAKIHADLPLLTTHDRGQVLAALESIRNDALVQSVIDDMIASKRLSGDSRRIARSDFKPRLSENQRKLKDRIVADHAVAGFMPPEPVSFANLAGGKVKGLVEIFEVAVAEGLLVKVSDEVYLHADAVKLLIEKIGLLIAKKGATVAEIRNELGTTRKYAVPICEYLDRAGVTRREGDLRVRV